MIIVYISYQKPNITVLRKHQKRPGSGKTGKDHRLWPNAFFAERGLFTMREAYLLARQSR
jgi:RNA-directed DNA polymerase